MKFRTCLLTVFTFSVLGLSARADVLEPLDSVHEKLDRLKSKPFVTEKHYSFPFLVVQIAVPRAGSVEQNAKRLDAYLRKKKLSFGREPKGNQIVSREKLILPKQLLEGDQEEAILKCSQRKCNMKLNASLESAKIEKIQDKKGKIAKYHSIVVKRVESFIESRQLVGYDQRFDNADYFRQGLSVLSFFEKRYPVAYKYLSSTFWKGKAKPKSFSDSFFREEIMWMNSDLLQMIWKISEVFPIWENNSSIYFELDVYTNHYFDSAFTVYEVVPQGKNSVIVMTDVMEIDELKKSNVVRFLYTGKMQDAVSKYQQKILENI